MTPFDQEGFVAREIGADSRPPSLLTRSLLSLFTGAGGLDVGLEAAGFVSCLCIENDPDAKMTLKRNNLSWRLSIPDDIHEITPQQVLRQAELRRREVDLLAGGPPCQPFSKSAYWANGGVRGLKDSRATTLKAFLRLIQVVLPKAILLENVSDLVADNGRVGGIELMQAGLSEINRASRTNYELQVLHLNAADYGIPQIRHRVFLVASIDGRKIDIPPPTHGSSGALLPIATAWDAIGEYDCPDWPRDLALTGKWADLLPSIPEGHNYLWHTPRGGGEPLFGWRTRYWSFLLKLSKKRPSWTIQAAPGPATGPFHWRNRLLSTQELARFQTFPDSYDFVGDRRSIQRQIGNAVPCALGEFVGLAIRRDLLDEPEIRSSLALNPNKRLDQPRAYPRQPVPVNYLDLRKQHPDHPGVGLGPGKRWEQ